MSLTSAQRIRCLEILVAITYSSSSDDYEKNIGVLYSSPYINVISYFKSNWEPIKEQWVVCFKYEMLSLGETTNNRIQSTFQKVKSVCSKFSTLRQFFDDSIKCNDEIMFAELVTPYAFKFIQKEKDVSLKVSYQVIPSSEGYDFKLVGHKGSYLCSKQSCTCNYVKKLSLPCHHIFYLRRYLNVSLYDEAIVNERWTKQNYMTTSKSRCNEDQMHVPVSDSCSVTFLKDEKMSDNVTLSQGQKFKKMRSLYTEVISLACEGGMVVFNSRFKELQNLLQRWRNKEDIPVLSKSYHLGDIDSSAAVSKLNFQSNLKSIPNHGVETNLPSTNDVVSTQLTIKQLLLMIT